MRLTIQAIRLFLKQAKVRRRIPNQATIEAMKEAINTTGLRRHGSFRELRERI